MQCKCSANADNIPKRNCLIVLPKSCHCQQEEAGRTNCEHSWEIVEAYLGVITGPSFSAQTSFRQFRRLRRDGFSTVNSNPILFYVFTFTFNIQTHSKFFFPICRFKSNFMFLKELGIFVRDQQIGKRLCGRKE